MSCQPPPDVRPRLEQRPLKLLKIFAEAGSMFCWHRWRVIQVSPRSAYEKCMRCGRHCHADVPRAAAPAPLAGGQGYSHRSDGKKLAGWPLRYLPRKLFSRRVPPLWGPSETPAGVASQASPPPLAGGGRGGGG